MTKSTICFITGAILSMGVLGTTLIIGIVGGIGGIIGKYIAEVIINIIRKKLG